MSPDPRPHYPRPLSAGEPGPADPSAAELNASLRRLGIHELEQRMEFSPLLIDQGLDSAEQDLNMPCCVCKITDPTQLDENGMLPYPQMDPGFDL